MKSKKAGKNISKPEVLNISKHGFWLFVKKQEYFLPFEQYPWFKEATMTSIFDVKMPHRNHLYWPELDVDLEVEALQFPEVYPLKYETQLAHLKRPQQKQVLGFIHTLAVQKGVRGEELLAFAGVISLDNLKQISEAIEQDCERIERDEG